MGSRRWVWVSALAVTFLCVLTAPSSAFLLPDTDQRKCYQAVDPYAEIPCGGTGQDGAFIQNPLSYTDNGDGTVTDNNTGLVWEKFDDWTPYNWFQASGTYDAILNQESTDACGSLDLGGATDWRLPSKKELFSIVDAAPYPGRTINPVFTNTVASGYWSSTSFPWPSSSFPISTSNAWVVNFHRGDVYYFGKNVELYVRCVRGGDTSGPILIANGDGTVTDRRTGLIWQQGEPGGKPWGEALSYCEELDLGGSTSWRLPNHKELESLTDDTLWNPSIDTSEFPDIFFASHFWSSTSEAARTDYAWSVSFYEGDVNSFGKHYALYVRCVRGGRYVSSVTVNSTNPSAGIAITVFPNDSSSQGDGTTPFDRTYDNGIRVTLTAPWTTGNNEFSHWGGCTDATETSCSVTLDAGQTVTANYTANTPPTGSIIINNGAAATITAAVTLNLPATDNGGSGLAAMRFANAGGPTCTWEPYQSTKLWMLSSGSGTKVVYVQFKDKAGNISDADSVKPGAQAYQAAIVYDALGPTGSIVINNGVASANSTSVTLNLSANDTGGSGLDSMRFANSGGTTTAWEPYQTTKSWTLPSGSGTKIVYVQFKDKAGNISDADPIKAGAQSYQASIICDAVRPTGSILINNGAESTNSTTVLLNLSANDTGGSGLDSMRFANSGGTTTAWEPYQTTKSWTLPSGSGMKIIYVQFKDKAGNISDADPVKAGAQSYKDEIIYDSTPPTGSIMINNGAALTSSLRLTLNLSATDGAGSGVDAMRFFNNGDTTTGWEPYRTTKAWTLQSNSGIITFFVQFRDKAGNISDADPVKAGAQSYSGTIQYTVPSKCEECHNGNSDYPLAPNVMGNGTLPNGNGGTPKPYDNGTWGFNVNGHGSNGSAANTPRDVDGYPWLAGNAECTDCHDISQPSTGDGRHLNGILNSVELKQNPSENTAHLISAFMAGTSSPEWDVQVKFDDVCYSQTGCHTPFMSHRHVGSDLLPVPKASRFGDGGSIPFGEGVRYPVDSDLTTNASTGGQTYVVCISCHNPHGTAMVEDGKSTNRMLRDRWGGSDTLCLVCHK